MAHSNWPKIVSKTYHLSIGQKGQVTQFRATSHEETFAEGFWKGNFLLLKPCPQNTLLFTCSVDREASSPEYYWQTPFGYREGSCRLNLAPQKAEQRHGKSHFISEHRTVGSGHTYDSWISFPVPWAILWVALWLKSIWVMLFFPCNWNLHNKIFK